MYQHTGHRRLTAILAAEVVDYVHRMAEFGEGATEALQAHRDTVIEPRIKTFDGRIVKQEGDSVIAEFASPLEAVRAAVAIQEGLEERNGLVGEDRRIDFRIGITVGEMTVENFHIYGDGAKVAARLKDAAEPGGICVSRSVLNQVKTHVPVVFEDLGEQEVPDFPGPVHAYRIQGESELPQTQAAAPADAAAPQAGRHWPAITLALATLVFLISGGLWLIARQPELRPADPKRMAFALPDKPSIAVLPFSFLSERSDEAPHADFLADRLSEEIISQLAQDRALFVIDRNSSFAYKERAVEPHRMAEELGVRFILTGRVRQEEEQAQITTQLIDTETGSFVWAHRFDAAAGSLSRLREGLVESIVVSLRGYLGTLRPAEIEVGATARATDPADYELVLRGITYKDRMTRADNEIAKELFAKAMERDPRFALAYAWLAGAKAIDALLGWSNRPEESATAALELARKAVELDPTLDVAHWAMGRAYLAAGDAAGALAEMGRALAINPNNADVMADLAWPLVLLGRSPEAVTSVTRAMRLNPHHGEWYLWRLGTGQYFAKRYDDAIASLGRIKRHNVHTRLLLAASYARDGDVARAREEVEEAIKLNPYISLGAFAVWRRRFAAQEDFEHLIAGLAQAGLSERPEKAPFDKPTIRVPPLDNISGDASQDYLAAGLTRDVVAELARVPTLQVRWRKARAEAGGRTRDGEASREVSGARYLLEGGIEKAANGFHIEARLVEPATGQVLWSAPRERQFQDLFAVRRALYEAVVATLPGQAAPAPRVEPDLGTKERAKKLDAQDYFYRALAFFAEGKPDANARARLLLEIALELDPDKAAAHSLLAWTHWRDRKMNWSDDPQRSLELGLVSAERAVALDERAYRGHWVRAALLRSQGDGEAAAAAYGRALELDPGDGDLLAEWGEFLLRRGEPDAAITPLRKAVALMPEQAERPLKDLSEAYYQSGQYEEAVGAGRRIADPALGPRSILVASLGQLGRIDEARAEIDAAREIDPGYSISSAASQWTQLQPAQRDHVVDGLRKAGLAE